MNLILEIETNSGRRFPLVVRRNCNLEEINREIERIYGFPTSSQTLSFNDVTIYSDMQLCSTARLINGSRIRLDINAGDGTRVQPPTPSLKRRGHSSAASTSMNAEELLPLDLIPRSKIEILPPPDDKIIVMVQFGEFCLKNGVKVKASKKGRRLRPAIFEETQIKIPDSYIFVHKGKPVKERKSFTEQNIVHGSLIEIYAPLNDSEFLQRYLNNIRNSCRMFVDGDHYDMNWDWGAYSEDDYIFVMTLKVLRGNETTEVDVLRTQAVSQLRVNLEKVPFIQLPERYSLFHKGNLLDEDFSFEAQNVLDGDEVILCDEADNDIPIKINVKVMHGSNETTEVNVLKTDLAYLLRVNMEKVPGIELPGSYLFIHKGNPLNEARPLAAQNVVGGDEVKLVNAYAWKRPVALKRGDLDIF